MRVALVVLLMLVLPSFVCAASLQERISAKEQPVSEEVLFDMERDVGRSIEAEADISIMRMADSIASTVVGISAHKSCPSLGEMAAPCASRLYSDLISKRATLCGNSTVAPEEPAVHDARKALLVFRTFLDVFAPTYPSLAVHGEEESDMWGMIRDDLDQGYEAIGSFQDLAHSGADYKRKDVKKLRGVIDGWCSYLDQREKENDYKDFISNPSAKEVHGHKGQSKFFWGHGVPSAKMSGMYNIRSLFEMQVNHAIELGFMLFKVDEIFSEVTHEAFHDYRKSMRSMLVQNDMCGDSLLDTSNSAKETLHTFKYLYDDFGELNDIRNGYIFALEHKDMELAQSLAAQVIIGWKLVRDALLESVVMAKAKGLPEHVCKCDAGC